MREIDEQLFLAVEDGDCGRIEALIKQGADVNAVCDSDKLDGMGAITNGWTPLLVAVSNTDIDAVDLLVDAHANVNTESSDWLTPLLSACDRGDLEIVKKLVENGANVNRKTGHFQAQGYTPLHAAVSYIWGGDDENRAEIAKYLISKGADINAQDARQETPLHCLIDDMDDAVDDWRTDAIMAILNGNPDLSIKNRDGETAYQAAKYKSIDGLFVAHAENKTLHDAIHNNDQGKGMEF